MTTLEGELPDDPCDDSVLLRLHAMWASSMEAVTLSKSGPTLGHVQRSALDGSMQLVLAVQRGSRRQVHFIRLGEGGWQFVKLGPHTYDVLPSIHIPGELHAFVTLICVPEVPAWG